MKKTKFVIERTATGYSAYAEKYSVFTVGSNLKQLKSNILEAINLFLEGQGKTVEEKDVDFVIDLPQFLEFYQVVDTELLSKRIGMSRKLLAQYVSGSEKPSAAQTRKILTGLQQIGQELAEIQLVL